MREEFERKYIHIGNWESIQNQMARLKQEHEEALDQLARDLA